MVTGGSYTWEHSITYRVVELLCCTPENNVTLCVSSTQTGVWVAQSVKCPTLDLSSGLDLRITSSSPTEAYLKTKQKPKILK